MKVPAQVWKKGMNGIMSVDYTRDLHKINQPALIFWGDQDTFCSRADQEVMEKKSKMLN